MLTPFDETMLRRAMRVAMNGRGRVEPNPMVGCVLVKNDTIIAEGHHTHFGGPHAEPAALADCQARGHDPRGATAYVTLEPCCHTNKKTPPCAPRLIEAGIARVVIGCLDPNPDVDGKGVAMLRDAGIVVDPAPPALAAELLQLIVPFALHRPYVTLKWAQTADGFIAAAGGRPLRITGNSADQAVHRLRTRCDAIIVGVNTVIADNPSLTVRGVPVIRQPSRVVLDRRLLTPPECRLLNDDGPTVTILCGPVARHDFADRYEVLSRKAAVHGVDDDDTGRSVLTHLAYPKEHAMVEPGPTLARSLLPYADRLWVFESSGICPDGLAAAAVPASYVETGRTALGPDTLIEYLNRDAESFHAAVPSADFILEREAIASQSPH